MEGPVEGWLEEMLRQHQQYYSDQKHRQQQRRQQQQHRQQQHQQRQELFRYRQQLQQHQQYYLQQQHELFRRQQHQQHYRQQQQQQQQQQHLQHYQLETAKKTSQVEARADGEETQAEMSGALLSSQTTLKPQSLCEYPAMLFVSQPVCREVLSTQDAQLNDMENGMLQPPQECEEKKRQLQALQLQQRSAPREPEAKFGDDRVASVAGYDTAHAREEHETLPRRQQPIPQADERFLVLAQMRLPAVSSDNMLVEGETSPVVECDGTVVVGDGLLVLAKGEKADGANADAKQEDSQPLEQQSPAWPPLLQQQQELLDPPPQEPWPPPIMAAEHGSGAGSRGESGLELERKVTFGGNGGCCDVDDGGLSGGNGFCKESGVGGDEESDRPDGSAWERAGIGKGARSRAFWGCEVAGRRLTRQRRARVRGK